ncbi:MAG: endonuclease NucS [Chloroflexota bacterium]|nr:endonuclease NucS [Chloroflexota bacterium]
MTDELKIWALGDGGEVEAVAGVASVKLEDLLEETLVRRPEMLESGLHLVGRQTPTGGGPLDLLGVDAGGRLVVYELKRGSLTRDAVTQCIDYASDLNAMGDEQLASHIATRSGTGGVEAIENFEEWYQAGFGKEDLGDLRPPRLVLVGLGVDNRAERMASFLRDGGIDISVLTFFGYERGGETLLARQIEVEAPTSTTLGHSAYKGAAQKRQELGQRLAELGVQDLFNAVDSSLRTSLTGTIQLAGSYGFTYTLATDRSPRGFYRVGVDDAGALQIHWLLQQENYSPGALATLKSKAEANDWQLIWTDRYSLEVKGEQAWSELQEHVLEFLSEAKGAWQRESVAEPSSDEPAAGK